MVHYTPKNLATRHHSQRATVSMGERLNGKLPIDFSAPSRPDESKVADLGAGRGLSDKGMNVSKI